MKTKICKLCGIEKPISDFYFRKDTNNYRHTCKNCVKKNSHNNKYNLFPWSRFFYASRRRCSNKNDKCYKYYGGRGIIHNITLEEIQFLWFRDKAYEMKKPTIDRKDNNGHYSLENCQFLEMDINRIKDRLKPILQYDLEGNFIREWESATQIERVLLFSATHITRVAKNKTKTAYRFIWRYKIA